VNLEEKRGRGNATTPWAKEGGRRGSCGEQVELRTVDTYNTVQTRGKGRREEGILLEDFRLYGGELMHSLSRNADLRSKPVGNRVTKQARVLSRDKRGLKKDSAGVKKSSGCGEKGGPTEGGDSFRQEASGEEGVYRSGWEKAGKKKRARGTGISKKELTS